MHYIGNEVDNFLDTFHYKLSNIQKDLLNKLMFELKRDDVLKSDESLTEAKIDMHIRDLLMEYVNSFDDLDYDIVSIIDNLIGLEKNLKKNGTTHDKMVFAFSVMPLLFHRFMDNEVISIYVLYFYYLGIMYSFPVTPFDFTYIKESILKLKNKKRSKMLSNNIIKEKTI